MSRTLWRKIFRYNGDKSSSNSEPVDKMDFHLDDPEYILLKQNRFAQDILLQLDNDKESVEIDILQKLSMDRLGLKSLNSFSVTMDDDRIEPIDTLLSNLHLYSSLTVLNLSYNRITFIPEYFSCLVHLEELFINNNHLGSEDPTDIHPLYSICNLPLKRLDISFNYFQYLPDLPHTLVTLNLNHNRPLSKLPTNFYKNHQYLTDLDISYCNLKTLNTNDVINNEIDKNLEIQEDNIGYLKDLKSFIIPGNNDLREIPEEIESLENIEIFSIYHQPIPSLPNGFGKHCLHLSRLDLHRLWLKELPESLSYLKELVYLDISMNHFESFPNIVCSLVSLIHLEANGFNWVELPDDFRNLTHLKYLSLRFNRFTEVFSSLLSLESLETLDLSGNFIETFNPDDKPLWNNLNCLNLSFNSHLKEITKSLLTLNNLKNVFIHDTEIEQRLMKNKNIYNHYLLGNWKCIFEDENIFIEKMKKEINSIEVKHDKIELSDEEFKDKVFGIIFGVAIGDAVGLATEFQSYQQAAICYGRGIPSLISNNWSLNIFRDKHRIHWENGDWTDDTDQMILILKCFIDNPKLDDYLLIDFANLLLNWAHRGFADLGDAGGAGIGQTLTKTLLHPLFILDPHKAADDIYNNSSGRAAANGGVMRTAITGIPFYYDLEKTIELTIKLCKITHADPRCIASTIAVSISIAMILQGYNDIIVIRNTAFVYAMEYTPPEYQEELQKFIFAESVKDLQLNDSNSIGYTFKAMGCGFVSLLYDNYENAILNIIMEAGDADTNGAVAGGIMGGYVGYSKLPKNWLNSLLHHDWLYEQVNEFYDILSKPSNIKHESK